MPLTVTQIEALKPEKTIRKPDGANLYLKVTAGGVAKTFEARPTVDGKRTWMSLGSFPSLSLKQARALASVVHSEIAIGTDAAEIRAALSITKDPATLLSNLRNAQARLKRVQDAKPTTPSEGKTQGLPSGPVDMEWTEKLNPQMTFREAAELWFPWKASTLSNGKHVAQIWTTLETYAFPKIGAQPIADVQKANIVSMLRPIWNEKQVTAKRTLGRVREVFENIAAASVRADNPAQIDTRAVFSTVKHQVKHHNALEWQEMPELIEYILNHAPMLEETRQATILMCLTAKRTFEIRSTEWGDLDASGKPVLTTPAERMKMKKRHRVPLSTQCSDIFANMQVILPGHQRVFARPNNISGMLSENTMLNYLKGYGKELTGHGMRASFRTWARVHKYDKLASEFALAHVQDSLSEAYMRDDLLGERAPMMQAWADFITGGRSLALDLLWEKQR